MKLIIGNYNYSTWSMRPWLFVRHHQLPVEIERLCLFSEQTLSTLAGHFSNAKVPLLIDDEFEVWDSLAILEYLAEQFSDTQGWPVDPKARAVARSVSAEMHSSFGALRGELPMNCRKRFPGYCLSAAALGDIERIQQIWRHCRKNYGSSGPWLFGEFSIADAMYAPVVMRFRSIEVSLDSVSQEYCETINNNAAVKGWIAQGKSETETLEVDELDWPGELIDPE